jgi:hypothetical protein
MLLTYSGRKENINLETQLYEFICRLPNRKHNPMHSRELVACESDMLPLTVVVLGV